MTKEEMNDLIEQFLDAWNTQDVEKVVACYSDDLIYKDPNTRGEITSLDAMRRYLTKLFFAWNMTLGYKRSIPSGQ